ncbi:hypothetical protein ACQPZP_17480 [Spirillospora sp. CA-142024]|uniref:hypothetical protein n=1 Tax=Spirillospora sp. CA-142024 TaxID=3240036 RepID=UPI003D92BF47
MDAARAISLVVEWIRSRNLDYPTAGLEADRFEAGWSVYAPVDVDESDPMAFLEMPVGRSVFLVGDSGRIEEVSSSVPPRQAQEQFIARERGTQYTGGGKGADEYMAEFVRWLEQDGDQDQPTAGEFSISGRLLGDPDDPEDLIGAETSLLVEEIVRQLAVLGPPGWEWLRAEFAFTVSAEIAHLRFSSDHRPVAVPVPESVAALVRDQRRTAALMPAGPWWRLLLTLTDHGEVTVDYDFGEGPFPHDQLLPPEHYRNDLEAYPRPHVAAWLIRYIAGPDAPDDSLY